MLPHRYQISVKTLTRSLQILSIFGLAGALWITVMLRNLKPIHRFINYYKLSRSWRTWSTYTLELSNGCYFWSLYCCWIMNAYFNGGKWSLRSFRCCSEFTCDLLHEALICCWSNFEKSWYTHCLMFHCFLESRLLNCFVILSTCQIISYHFLNFLKLYVVCFSILFVLFLFKLYVTGKVL